jgi:excisionase family DNA binding protein
MAKKGGFADLIAHLRTLRKCLTPKEMAVLLHKHPETIYKMIKKGFPAFRDGRRLKLDPCKVADWLEKRRA